MWDPSRDPLTPNHTKCGKKESCTTLNSIQRAMQACRFQALAIWGKNALSFSLSHICAPLSSPHSKFSNSHTSFPSLAENPNGLRERLNSFFKFYFFHREREREKKNPLRDSGIEICVLCVCVFVFLGVFFDQLGIWKNG